jgi:hypothetical protein
MLMEISATRWVISGGDHLPPDPFRDLGDDGVPEAAQSVQPRGNPMSHSTHVGFNAPVFRPISWDTASSSLRMPPPGVVRAICPPPVGVFGVGHRPRLAIIVSWSDPCRPLAVIRTWLASLAVGVGQRPRSAFIARWASGVFPSSCPTGVGHNEDPVTEMRGTEGGRGDTVPFRIVPERGQVPKNLGHSRSSKEPWDVLQEREAGS